MTELKDKTEAISIEKLKDRTVITYKKSKIIGLASTNDVMNTVLIAARMQAERYIEKLSKGETLTDKEVASLAQLASITKIAPPPEAQPIGQPTNHTDIEVLKSNIYARLLDKPSQS